MTDTLQSGAESAPTDDAGLLAAFLSVYDAQPEEIDYDGAQWNTFADGYRAALARRATAPQPVQKQAGWVDEFGNVFPLGAYSIDGKPNYHDAHKRNWKPLYTGPVLPAVGSALVAKTDLMRMIDRYASKRALQSFLEASRVATDRKDRGPRKPEHDAQDAADTLRRKIAEAIAAPAESAAAPAPAERNKHGMTEAEVLIECEHIDRATHQPATQAEGKNA